MKVKELIQQLKGMDPKAEVMFAYEYGDHWHTVVASEIREAQSQKVEWSSYHEMWQLPSDDEWDDDYSSDSEDEEDPAPKKAVVLR